MLGGGRTSAEGKTILKRVWIKEDGLGRPHPIASYVRPDQTGPSDTLRRRVMNCAAETKNRRNKNYEFSFLEAENAISYESCRARGEKAY